MFPSPLSSLHQDSGLVSIQQYCHQVQIGIMASLKSIYTSNCETEIPKINCTHEWVIPNFESWSQSENPDRWLNDSPFCPLQGIQLQLKILGSGPKFSSDIRVFLVNRDQNPIYLSACSLDFYRPYPARDGFTHMTERKPKHELVLSDEFNLHWNKYRAWNGPREPWFCKDAVLETKFEQTSGNWIPKGKTGKYARIRIKKFACIQKRIPKKMSTQKL